MKFFTAIFTFLLTTSTCNALTIREYKDYKINPTKAEFLNTYLAGMGQGIFFSSIYNNQKKLPQIFCPPPSYSVTGNVTNKILDEFINKNNFDDTQQVSVIFIFALRDRFPCK